MCSAGPLRTRKSLLEGSGTGLGHVGVLGHATTADADGAHDDVVADQQLTAAEDHQTAVGGFDAEQFLTGLGSGAQRGGGHC